MVRYQETLGSMRADNLLGFFAEWPARPSAETQLAVLANSDYLVVAVDEASGQVLGFITALSDGVLTAHISLLEVLPTHRRRGIGSELVQRMLLKLQHLYAVDLLCDPELQSFYGKLGMVRASGMCIRRYERTSGS
ncbi:MAG: GNAT family N-acetyltransferase [Chloroflexi bacterium]|nr:GNAT family N-acetyltransferase [Chloroflexota bacterium]